MIKEAINTAGGSITTCASPWSAPAFMKNTNNMLQGGKLLPQYREAWATYFTKFIQAYESEGIPIWGITVQNEPMAKQTWESMIYTAEEERDFLRDYLGPIMHKAGLGDKKIVVWDHNRDLITHRANAFLAIRKLRNTSGESVSTGTKHGPAANRCLTMSRKSNRRTLISTCC